MSKWAIVLSFVILAISIVPSPANAGFLSFLADLFNNSLSRQTSSPATSSNSQTLPLLQSASNYNLTAARGGGDITVVDNEALMSENGPSGTLADISDSAITGQISKYTVRKGDTLSSIAKMFGVTTNTIVWANDIPSKIIREGQVLVILPVSGTIHTVAKGDTLASIAKKYKGNLDEISQFNDLGKEALLAVGDTIIVPDGESTVVVTSSSGSASSGKVTAKPHDTNGPNYTGYYIRPVSGGTKTQGLHGYNAIDIGIPVGSPVVASAPGEVIISKTSGWNSGYGRYIVISHYNGTQTLYGHLSENLVAEGETVSQGQYIGLTGNTGKSTGPHIHFEIRGAKNQF